MVIVINAVSFFSREKESDFLYNTINRLSERYTEHHFIFVFGEEPPIPLITSNHVKMIHTGTTPRNLLWAAIKQKLQIRKIIKEEKAAILISIESCFTKIKIPQLLMAPDLSYLFQPGLLSKKQKAFSEKRMPGFLKNADCVIVHSLYEKELLEKKYPSSAEKIKVIHEAPIEKVTHIDFEERELLKEKYAGGNEYFIYAGTIGTQQNLVHLLKAFSFFKKRQRSNMQLVICGKQGNEYADFEKAFDHYRFKDQVKLQPGLSESENHKIMAASYAIIFPAAYINNRATLFTAMQCEVPVIISSGGSWAEITGDSALYVDIENSKDIAEKMMALFKDEKLRSTLIENGKQQIQKYNFTESVDEFWKVITGLVK